MRLLPLLPLVSGVLLAVSSAGAITLNNLLPNSAVAGGPSFLLTVNGSGFTNARSISWNGALQTTSFVNSGQLRRTFPRV
jgi:hypothetical protein